MTDSVPQQHPSPHRGRVGLSAQLSGLAAGPAAWIAQLIVDYGLSSYACFPKDAPRLVSPPPGWAGEHLWLLAINLACLALAGAGFASAYGGWRLTRAEKRGDAHEMLEIGEGRARFLAICGMLGCGVFAAAILFDTLPILGVPACWQVAR
jgi:hypothetical protein